MTYRHPRAIQELMLIQGQGESYQNCFTILGTFQSPVEFSKFVSGVCIEQISKVPAGRRFHIKRWLLICRV